MNSTSLPTFPGLVAGCTSFAPGRPFNVRFWKPMICTYSAQVPFTDTVYDTLLSNLDSVRFSDWPLLQSTETGMDCTALCSCASEATETNRTRIPSLIHFIASP